LDTANNAKVKDSGKRQEFSTGSRRDTQDGKPRYDLISPIMLTRLGIHLAKGAVKYGDRNWEKGQPLMRYVDSALRHLYKWQARLGDEDHLTAAIWNLQAALHTEDQIMREILPEELDDRPRYGVGTEDFEYWTGK
jgi:hypothetical protein